MVSGAATDFEAVAEEIGVAAAGQRFFFKNSSLRPAFLLKVDGLAFFFFLLSKAKGTLCLVSREKEKVEPMLREKLISKPWLVSAWQKSKHLMAKEELASSTAVILAYF